MTDQKPTRQFEPSYEQMTTWLEWNRRRIEMNRSQIRRINQQSFSVMEQLCDAPLGYYYQSSSSRKLMTETFEWQPDPNGFHPTAIWIRRCDQLDIEYLPWLWPNFEHDWDNCWSQLHKYGMGVSASTSMGETNRLVRIFTVSNNMVQAFGFEVNAHHAMAVEECVRIVAKERRALVSPDDLAFLRTLQEREANSEHGNSILPDHVVMPSVGVDQSRRGTPPQVGHPIQMQLDHNAFLDAAMLDNGPRELEAENYKELERRARAKVSKEYLSSIDLWWADIAPEDDG